MCREIAVPGPVVGRTAAASVVAAFVLALALVSTASARQSASPSLGGRVTDARGGAVAGASVTLYARGSSSAPRLTTTTDETGAYRFERLAPGTYLVAAEAAGFARAASIEVAVGGGGAAPPAGDITLQVADVSAEVVVTAADTPQPVDEVSKAVNVIGRQELDERGEYSIPEALRTVPGLRVRQLGGPGSLTTIRTRGLRNEDTAVLVDGLRLRDPSAPQADASSLIGDLTTADVSRVEVLRGSGSSLYGTNAVGGVVNIITEEGGGPFRGSLLAEGGSLGLFRGRAQVAGGAGEADRLAYSAGLSHLNVARGVDGDDAARNTGAQGRATFRLTPSITLSGRGYFADSFAQTNNNPFPVAGAGDITDAVALSGDELRRYEAGTPVGQLNLGAATYIPSTNNPDARQRGRFFSGALVFTHRLGEDASYAVSYQGLDVTRANLDGALNQRFDFDGRTHTLNARADFRLGRANHVTAGYEFESEEFSNRLSFGDPLLDTATAANERSHALFAQDQLRLLDDRLQLSAAFRAQFFRLDEPRFEPATGNVFNTTPDAPHAAYTGDGSVAYLFRSTGTKLRAHVGNGYRAPSLFERFGASFFGGRFFPFGNPELRPERSLAFDAGWDQSLYDNRLRLSATYFYTRLQETIVFDFPYRNAGGGLARGAELSAEAAPTATTDLFASYTYTNSDQRAPQTGGVISTFTAPDHQASLVLTQRLGRRLSLNFDLAASGSYLLPLFDPATFTSRVFRFGGLFKADLGASYRLPLADARTLRLFVLVENLFDRDYYEGGFRTPGVGARAGAAFGF